MILTTIVGAAAFDAAARHFPILQEARKCVRFIKWMAVNAMSFLDIVFSPSSIQRVDRWSNKFKMKWVNALHVSANMMSIHSFWDISSEQFVGNPMGIEGFSRKPESYPNGDDCVSALSVVTAVESSGPIPTSGRFIKLKEIGEAFYQWFWWSSYHNNEATHPSRVIPARERPTSKDELKNGFITQSLESLSLQPL